MVDVFALIRCMAHPRSNIAALHFDGPTLEDMKQAHLAISNPVKAGGEAGTISRRCGHCNQVFSQPLADKTMQRFCPVCR